MATVLSSSETFLRLIFNLHNSVSYYTTQSPVNSCNLQMRWVSALTLKPPKPHRPLLGTELVHLHSSLWGRTTEPRDSPAKGSVVGVYPGLYGVKLCWHKLAFRGLAASVRQHTWLSVEQCSDWTNRCTVPLTVSNNRIGLICKSSSLVVATGCLGLCLVAGGLYPLAFKGLTLQHTWLLLVVVYGYRYYWWLHWVGAGLLHWSLPWALIPFRLEKAIRLLCIATRVERWRYPRDWGKANYTLALLSSRYQKYLIS